MSRQTWLAFAPRDTLFVRDGRSFDAAADAAGQAVRPGPSTTAGAVGAAFHARPGAQPGQDGLPLEVRGPVLAQREGDSWHPYYPMPADVVVTADEPTPYAFRLEPGNAVGHTDLTGGDPPSEGSLKLMMPPAAARRVKPLAGWLPANSLTDYLAGTLIPPDGVAVEDLEVEQEDPLRPETRIGLARDASRRVREGFLYRATHLRPMDGWAILAECELADGFDRVAEGPVKLGGQGRLADVETAAGLPSWPGHGREEFPGGRVLVYLATPAIWPDGWRLPLPDGAELVAAVTGEPEPVATTTPGSGWKDSRALRWAVPAGSVYLLRFTGANAERDAAAWARKVNGKALKPAMDKRLRTAGFGVVLTGVWK